MFDPQMVAGQLQPGSYSWSRARVAGLASAAACDRISLEKFQGGAEWRTRRAFYQI
ncbi:MAG: hypothetical protein HKO71_08100 [Pseudomonadales bacterium]|nr:hypothetical protein [Pseudomonadales bacterium]